LKNPNDLAKTPQLYIYVEWWCNEHSASDVDSIDNIFMFMILHYSFNSVSKFFLFPTLHSLPNPPYFFLSWYASVAVKNDVQNLKADGATKGQYITIILPYFDSFYSWFSPRHGCGTFGESPKVPWEFWGLPKSPKPLYGPGTWFWHDLHWPI
jgi:hypothetical protein